METRERCEITFRVASYESDLNGAMSLFALFNRFQELAGAHAAHLGVGYDRLRESHLAWILSRIMVDLQAPPSWGDTVTLATWPKGVDRLFALRDFSLTGPKGKVLVLATSAWLLVDLAKQRPQRIESLPLDLRFPGAPDALAERPDKIALPDGPAAWFERPVWLSDIDVNHHVNNAQYAKWIGDCFPEETFRARRTKRAQINYLEATLPHDIVKLRRVPEHDRAMDYCIEGVSGRTGSVAFQSRVEWGPSDPGLSGEQGTSG
jgi:acyl-ACP thioesterase